MSVKVVHILKINELVCMTDNKCVRKLHDDILSFTFTSLVVIRIKYVIIRYLNKIRMFLYNNYIPYIIIGINLIISDIMLM